jgi:hypothetical protein
LSGGTVASKLTGTTGPPNLREWRVQELKVDLDTVCERVVLPAPGLIQQGRVGLLKALHLLLKVSDSTNCSL